MKAEITKCYAIAPEGHTTLRFNPGEIVTGRIAEQAIADGYAVEFGPPIETPKPQKLETPAVVALEGVDAIEIEKPEPAPVAKKRRTRKS